MSNWSQQLLQWTLDGKSEHNPFIIHIHNTRGRNTNVVLSHNTNKRHPSESACPCLFYLFCPWEAESIHCLSMEAVLKEKLDRTRISHLAMMAAVVQINGMDATTLPISSGLSCSDPTISRRRSRAMAVIEMVDTKTDVAWSKPIRRQATWKPTKDMGVSKGLVLGRGGL